MRENKRILRALCAKFDKSSNWPDVDDVSLDLLNVSPCTFSIHHIVAIRPWNINSRRKYPKGHLKIFRSRYTINVAPDKFIHSRMEKLVRHYLQEKLVTVESK